MQTMTFFERFERDILAGRKTITLRDHSESYFKADETVVAANLETGISYGQLYITDVAWVNFDDLNEHHARQENMSLADLKKLIREIYPEIEQLYQITFKLL
ncbi:N(4)-acetylcytidine aminohydrolase [Shewanella youngdeokensis]|uniref:N(4)-acetylcytidine amidohydrolase n=1 Tax=Shewanella youngdeokensis TaxID=2999068 RepID=A0ABZ0K3C0_9GAMM|nr:N(4)-acetylcytidine aminohydrolase [Shewanella sp. DAU334]